MTLWLFWWITGVSGYCNCLEVLPDRWKIWCHMQWFLAWNQLQKIHSNSVGYKTDYEMFSMDFEEFLWAKGYSEKHIEDILQHMQTGTPFSETELSVYKNCFGILCTWRYACSSKSIYWKNLLQILWKSRDRSRWIMKRISENTLKVWIRLKL